MLARAVLRDIDPVLAGGHDRPGWYWQYSQLFLA
jgi:hypothetical protein